MEEEYSFKQYPHLGHVHSHLQALPLKCLLRPFALCLLPIYSLVASSPLHTRGFLPLHYSCIRFRVYSEFTGIYYALALF